MLQQKSTTTNHIKFVRVNFLTNWWAEFCTNLGVAQQTLDLPK